MAIEIKAPTFPESVADGTVATWHKQPGDAVKRDELLVDIETDKVVLEVLAEADGVLGEIIKGEGETVLSAELLGTLNAGATAEPKAEAAAAPAPPAAPAAAAQAAGAEEPLLNPAARKRAVENGLGPAHDDCSGKGGRLSSEGVRKAIETQDRAPAAAPAATPAAAPRASSVVLGEG